MLWPRSGLAAVSGARARSGYLVATPLMVAACIRSFAQDSPPVGSGGREHQDPKFPSPRTPNPLPLFSVSRKERRQKSKTIRLATPTRFRDTGSQALEMIKASATRIDAIARTKPKHPPVRQPAVVRPNSEPIEAQKNPLHAMNALKM